MAILTTYDHTARLIHSGLVTASSSLIINLYTVLPANTSAATKAAAEAGATQLPTANGYTQNSKVITGQAIATFGTGDSQKTCDQVLWTASGGNLEAGFAMVYADSLADDPPLYRYDFEGVITASSGFPFVVNFPDGLEQLLTN